MNNMTKYKNTGTRNYQALKQALNGPHYSQPFHSQSSLQNHALTVILKPNKAGHNLFFKGKTEKA